MHCPAPPAQAAGHQPQASNSIAPTSFICEPPLAMTSSSTVPVLLDRANSNGGGVAPGVKRRRFAETPPPQIPRAPPGSFTSLQLLRDRRYRAPHSLYLLQSAEQFQQRRQQQQQQRQQLLGTASTTTVGTPTPWLRLEDGISEIAGEAGSGKTQVALSLCVDAAAYDPPLASDGPEARAAFIANSSDCANASEDAIYIPGSCRAVYIGMSTSSKLTKIVERLQQMVEARQLAITDSGDSIVMCGGTTHSNPLSRYIAEQNGYYQQSSPSQQQDWMQRILTKVVVNQDYLLDLITHELPALLDEEPNIRVVVLDSIADLFRIADHRQSFATRSTMLFGLASRLKWLSDRFHVPIVVVNQITNKIGNPSVTGITQPSQIIPALGLSWAQCVNRSYILSRGGPPPAKEGVIDRRKIQLHRSSHNQEGATAAFCIQIDGVFLC